VMSKSENALSNNSGKFVVSNGSVTSLSNSKLLDLFCSNCSLSFSLNLSLVALPNFGTNLVGLIVGKSVGSIGSVAS